MKDRVVTAVGALLALLACVALLFGDAGPPASWPTSADRGPNGYAALHDWLDATNIGVETLRDAIDDESLAFVPGRRLLITTLPHRRAMTSEERRRLRAWVGDGNTLLVMAALNDSPDWIARVNTSTFLDDVSNLTRVRFEPVFDEAGDEVLVGGTGNETSIVLNGFDAHPLLGHGDTFEGVSDDVTGVWEALRDPLHLRIPVASEAQHGPNAILHLPSGNGQIFVVALGSMLTNRAIGRADNRHFIASLVRHHVDGGVIFDDFHQGLSTIYDPAALFRDPRLYVSILFVLAAWFVYMVGTWNRLAPAREEATEPGQLDFVQAVGGFLARKLDPVESGRMMFATRFAEIAGESAGTGMRTSRRPGTVDPAWFERPPWPRLEANPLVDPTVLDALKADHARLAAGNKVDLRQLHNRLREFERRP